MDFNKILLTNCVTGEVSVILGLNFGTAYHPQSDGQLEWTIQTLKDMIRLVHIGFQGVIPRILRYL
jgi:hypothetical protein